MRSLLLTCALLASSPARAQLEIQADCQSPREHYVVKFQPMQKQLLVASPGATVAYEVSRVEPFRDGFMAQGATVKDGPSFTAFLGGAQQSMNFMTPHGIQEDKCVALGQH